MCGFSLSQDLVKHLEDPAPIIISFLNVFNVKFISSI